MKLKIFFCQFPNPWALRVSGMGCYTSKCEKSQNHCTLIHTLQRLADVSSKSVLVPGFVHGATCCAACSNSDVCRTNLFLVWGLVYRGIPMQRNHTAKVRPASPFILFKFWNCSQGEMWLNMTECICPLSLAGYVVGFIGKFRFSWVKSSGPSWLMVCPNSYGFCNWLIKA